MDKSVSVAIVAADSWYGGINYTRNMIKCILDNSSDMVINLYIRDHSNKHFKDISGSRLKVFNSSLAIKILNRVLRLLHVNDIRPTTHIIQKRVALVYNYDSCHAKALAWVPDIQHEYMPNLYSFKELQTRQKRMKKIAAKSKTIVFSSQSEMAAFIQKYSPKTNDLKVISFHTLLSKEDLISNEDEISEFIRKPYFMICNQFWKHKDHLTAFSAFKRFLDAGYDFNLICTGVLLDQRSPEYSDIIRSKIVELGIEDKVKLTGHISRQNQILLMRKSFAIIQPSLYEGWSTVVEDSRLLGKRLVLSDLPVHFEQNYDGSIYFRAGDSESLLLAMMQATRIQNSDLNDQQILEKAVFLSRRMFKQIREVFNEYF